jgi:MbtH protein
MPAKPSPYFKETKMNTDEKEDTTIYKAVVNHEEQYSIWPAHRENALGWNDAGKTGTKAECLVYIKEVWTDMRPLSLRKQMEENAARASREAGDTPLQSVPEAVS